MSDPAPTPSLRERLQQFDMNPVWVKDLRQAARNPFVAGALLLVLAIFLLVCASITLGNARRFSGGSMTYAGGQVFQAISSITVVTAYIFLPIYFFSRTLMERASINSDLLYITKMTPQQIVRGKFLSALYMILLFYSAALPFLMASYLFRGVDLPTILLSVGFNTSTNLLLTLAAITLALTSLSIFLKISLGLILGFLAFVYGVSQVSIPLLISAGPAGVDILSPILLGTYGLNYLLIVGLVYQLAVAMVSPTSSNRALPIRRYISVLLFLVLGQLFYWAWSTGEEDFATIGYLSVGVSILNGFLLFSGTTNAPVGPRIQRTIPKNFLLRIPAFLFYNGKFAGLCWLVALWVAIQGTFALFLAGWGQFQPAPYFHREHEYLSAFLGCSLFVLYAFAYSLLAIGVQRLFFPNKNPNLASPFFLLLVCVPPLATLAISVSSGNIFPLGDDPIPGMMLNLVPCIFDENTRGLYIHLGSSLALIVLGIGLNWRWIWEQMRQFRPLEETSVEAQP